ncbi:MAG: cytochrome b N-terminal domain-containing protein [Verrucomicrobia subdivision 3 bacterium]|nr:cytochrome b N-terminal domain-containing protein [Limisphaerales bacterium]
MKFFDWLDGRTGYRKIIHEALYENVPGGARWRYVWGSTLTFTLAVQFITGIFLWMAYSPSSQTAWESVYYIQNEMTGGWLLRGIHHFTAQAMTILLVLHLMQVIIDGAYKAPREVNFWFGVALLFLVLGLSLTGYLLPWDQKGYWATKVATNIMALTPIIGPALQKILIGGADYGHHTLTRFFALHAGVLPGLIIVLLVGHIYLFRRHGLTAKEPRRRPDAPFWPDQLLKDAVACLAVLAVIMVFVLKGGAELGAPADPSEPFAAARPEWYFLFLFQLLEYFKGQYGFFDAPIVGALILPGLIMLILVLMPIVGKWRLGHRFNLSFTVALLLGAAMLTAIAVRHDAKDADYNASLRTAHRDSERVKVLARARGIPPSGAAALLREDAFAQGPRIFARNCASCHRYDGHDGLAQVPSDPQSAPDLKGFASREWIAGMLDPARISSSNYFGATKFADGKMAKWVKRNVPKHTAEQQAQMRQIVIALSAEAQLKSQRALDEKDSAEIKAGREFIDGDVACTECHKFHKENEEATAPDLTGYGSRQWMIDFITNPAHERFYGKRSDRMPAYGVEKMLDQKQIEMVVDWLRGDWFEPDTDLVSK